VSWGQVFVTTDTMPEYKKFKSIGTTYRSRKVGKWLDKDDAGNVYKEYFYDSIGGPIGKWTNFCPNGQLRKVTEYENNVIIKWFVYRINRPLFEVIPSGDFSMKLYCDLDDYEIYLYKTTTEVFYFMHPRTIDGITYPAREPLCIDPFYACLGIKTILKNDGFSGMLIIYNANSTIRWKCQYINGIENGITYYYKGKTVIQQDEYIEDKIVKTIYFKKNGEQKIKLY